MMTSTWPNQLFMVLCLAAGGILAALTWFLLRNREYRGAPPALLLAGVGLWLLGSGAGAECGSAGVCTFWEKTQFLGANLATVGLIELIVIYADRARWITRRNMALVTLIPAGCALLGWTNEFHGLVWGLDPPGAVLGPGLWAGFACQSLAVVLGLVVFARKSSRLTGTERRQAAYLFCSLFLPLIGEVIFLGGWNRPAAAALTQFGFTSTALIIFRAYESNNLPGLDAISRRQVVEHMPDMVVVLDLHDRVVDLNPPALQYIGVPRDDALGHSLQQLIPQELEHLRKYQHVWNTHEYMEFGPAEARQFFSVSLTPLYDRRQRLCGRMAILRDTSDLQKSEAALKEANARLEVLNQRLVDEMKTRELVQQQALEQQRRLAAMDERERLARDLHDNLGQVLGFFNMQARASRQHLEKKDLEIVDGQLQFISEMALESQTQLRDTIRELKSPVQVERRFIPNLVSLVEKFEHDFGIPVTREIDAAVCERGFDGSVTPQLLNIIQEGLNNAAKHACAAWVRLEIAAVPYGEQAEIRLIDEGCGFDPNEPLNEKVHFGLRFMQERAVLAGGTFNLQSQPGQGTRITVRVPLRRVIQGEIP